MDWFLGHHKMASHQMNCIQKKKKKMSRQVKFLHTGNLSGWPRLGLEILLPTGHPSVTFKFALCSYYLFTQINLKISKDKKAYLWLRP